MTKLLFTMLVVVIGLTPALVAAQGTNTGGGGTPGTSDKGTSSSESSSTPSTVSPSASPSTGSGTSTDFSQFKTKADCERAGGLWQMSTSTCEKATR